MMRQILREPLLYFLLTGAALFAVSSVLGSDRDRHIVVTDAELSRLADQWQAQMGRAPTASELRALTDQWIREEIYYREARAMGLDDDDVIVRRRLAQKLTFLTEDMATSAPPEQSTLKAYYRAHAGRYVEPERFSFEHRYFSADRRADAKGDARRALDGLQASGVSGRPGRKIDAGADAGDAFMLQRSYAARSRREISELFGDEFATALAGLTPGRWQGPVRSAYGWHLVKVQARLPERRREFAEVADQVAADFREDQRRKANEDFYHSLLDRYEIVRR